jgi:hypothetical protein
MYETMFQGEIWHLRLHPTDNSNREVSTASDVHKDFVLALSGAVPGSLQAHYGAEVKLSSSTFGVPADAFFFEIVFTPIGPLIDNSRGEVLQFRSTWEMLRLRLSDIPIGAYAVSATVTYPDRRRYLLYLSTGSGEPWRPSVNIGFKPDRNAWMGYGSAESLRLYINTEPLVPR